MNYNDDSIFTENDDDIFRDDNSSSEKITDALASHIKSEHGMKIDSDILKDIDTNNVRAKMVIAILEASARWDSNSQSSAFTKASHLILDELTNNRFSKAYEFYRIEIAVIQRKVVIQVLRSMLEGNFEDLEEIKLKIGLDITPTFLSTYINTFLKILVHVVDRDRAMYVALSKELNLPTQQVVLYEEVDNQGIYTSKAYAISRVAETFTDSYVKSLLAKSKE
jgi:hypothetical protein